MGVDNLFFELIRVAIGTQNTLSRPPSACEWKELYNMAKKQSLVGICFAGLQKLYNSVNQEPSTQNAQPNSTQNQALELCSLRSAGAEEPRTQNLDEVQYLTWMGMAAKIQQRNEVVSRQCVELQAKLAADGFAFCILKGQGVASLYDEHLRGLRQSGDIDIWVDGNRDEIIKYISGLGVKTGDVDMKHWDVQFFDETEVEVHFRPTWFYNPIHDRRLMKWVSKHKEEQFANIEENGIVSPSIEFNLCFLLIHIYRHLFEEGIGLRQLLDYYFVLLASNEEERKEAYDMVCKLGMKKFTAAVMHVLRVSFGLKEEFMLCNESPERGRVLLDEIMIGGNFGKFDTRYGVRRKGRLSRGFNTIERNMRFFCSYPSEILWAPMWKIWHWCWRWKNGYLNMK